MKWGEGGGRERNHWSASQCLCLCLGFHLYPQQQAASASSPHPSLSPSFPLLSRYLSRPGPHLSTIQVGPNFPLTPPSLYTPANRYSPCLCLCSSLALGVVRLDAEEKENPSGRAQLGGARRSGEEREPVAEEGLQDFPSERHNPDVWASFIRKESAPNGHAVQQHAEY